MEVSWEVEGLQALEKKLIELGAKAGLTALRRASRDAMKPVKDQMEQTAPFDNDKASNTAVGKKDDPRARSEHMRDKITMITAKANKRTTQRALAVRVGPTKAHARKALSAEYGVENQEPTPFMRKALHDNKEQVVAIMKTRLAAEIERIARKQNQ